MAEKKIKILMAEDSPVQAALIRAIFEAQDDMEIIGHAQNGEEVIKLASTLKPDIITMDIEMPKIDGLEATRQIMRNSPLPIVILSSYVNDSEMRVPFHALDYGALAVLQKPGDMKDPNFSSIEEELIEVVRAMSEVKVVTHRHKPRIHYSPWMHESLPKAGDYKLIALGCSTGGPITLRAILSELPADFSLPIVIVQHMFQHFTEALIAWLSKQTPLKLKLAQENEILMPGTVYFAPHDQHLLIVQKKGQFHIHLTHSDKFMSFRPSVTVLFNALAETFGGKVIAGILTGLGDDGAEGLRLLRDKGAFTFVQKPDTCVVATMPESAIKVHATDQIIPLDEIPAMLKKITNS